MPLPESQEPNGVAVEHCRVWLKWAAAHVEECLTRDSLASNDLLAALADVLGPEGADLAGAKMSAIVIAVQSHDRVMQGLAHVAEALRGLHAQLGDVQRADSAESWRTLREAQFRAFSMAQERALFARMVAREEQSRCEADLNQDETVELFASDPGLFEP